MKNYLLIYKTPIELQARMGESTPEEMAEGMKPWLAWRDRIGDQMVDFGAPTGGAKVLGRNTGWQAEASEASGYSIIKARNETDLENLLQDHPHTQWSTETRIEIHECVDM